jgi:hypothetical protein
VDETTAGFNFGSNDGIRAGQTVMQRIAQKRFVSTAAPGQTYLDQVPLTVTTSPRSV